MMAYGWISDKDSLISAAFYNRSRREFSHRWSAESLGEVFGYREWNELIPLKDYLHTPMLVIEDLLEGVAKGTSAIKKAREAARSPKDKRELDPNHAIQQEIRELNKLKGKS